MSTGCSSRNTTSIDRLPKVKENSRRRGRIGCNSQTQAESHLKTRQAAASLTDGLCSYTCKACTILYRDEGGDREAPLHPYLFVDNYCWEREV